MRGMFLHGALATVMWAGAAAAQAVPSLEGEWVGGFRLADSTRYIEVHIRGAGPTQQATLDFPLEQRGGIPMRVLQNGGTGVTIEVTLGSETLTFDARPAADGLEGTVSSNGKRAPFRLLRLARPDLARFAEISGNYETAPGHTISIGQIQDVMNLPVFYDHVTRRMALLLPLSDSGYIAGASLGVAYPVDVRATVVRAASGAISGLRWQEGMRPPIVAKRLHDHTREEVTFRNGSVVIAATLWLPTGSGPRPAIVNVMGPSGSGTRNLGETAPFFVRQGVAVLEYDKRGAGKSTGDWRSATMEDLAGDARAAFTYLKSRSDIDARRLGAWGTSNGAWVVPMVAAPPSDVSFVIVRSVPALSATENVMFEVERDLRAARFSEDEIRRGLALRRMLGDALARSTGWESVAAAIRAEPNDRLLGESRTPRAMADLLVPLDSTWYRRFRDAMMHDPIPYWRQVTVPVLAFLGGRDASIPTERTRAMFEKVFGESGNRRASLRVLPTANHIMFETAANDPYLGARRDTSPLNAYSAPGYHDAIAAWLKLNVTNGGPPRTP